MTYVHCVLDIYMYAGVECPVLKQPKNGNISTTNSNQYMSVANYECNAGYYIYGSVTRQCQANGMWTDTAPGCIGWLHHQCTST